MSLELAAQHLASRGRGPDTQLVHMAPQEVAGLHALAKAHGGELTINPDTGLPEAGFLSSILPMVIGGTLMAMTGGAAAPLIAGMSNAAVIGLGTGAVTGLATGSLSKGLMAGLGAFGGAGLAGGLVGAGAGAAQQAAMAGVSEAAASPLMGLEAAALENPAMAGFQAANTGAASTQLGSTLANPTGIPGFTGSSVGLTPPPGTPNAAQLTGGMSQVNTATTLPELSKQGLMNQAAADATRNYQASGIFDQLGAGAKEVWNDPSRFMTKENLKYAGMAAAPGIMELMAPKPYKKPDEEKPYEYTYSAGRRETPEEGYTGAYTGERTYFNPVYTRTAAGGGLMDIQPVEAMSQQNQSQMRPAYAQGGVSDMAVNAYTGAESFAEGGDIAEKPAKDPYNTMTGQSAAMYDYLMGQGQRPAAAPRAPAPVMAAPQSAELADASKSVAPLPGGNAFLGQPPAGAAAVGPAPITAARSDEPLTMSYTFDPVTGGFRKLAPTEANYAAPETTTGMGYYGDYGGDSGSAGVGPGPGTGEGGGMGNTGEGGGAAGEGGWARGGIASLAQGGQSHLGDYSDGGRFLRNANGGTTSDGISDSIPASIGGKRPARLAENEFVIPARIVSELGNGSSEAGARRLYAMMDRIQKARGKTVGKGQVAVDTKPEKMLPA